MAGKVRKITKLSAPHTIAKLDGRTRESILMRRVRAELTAHCGGRPTCTERLLIERCVVLSLKCAQIDEMILRGDPLTQHDATHALAWNNALRRALTALGQGKTTQGPTLADHLAKLTTRAA